jgi:hypothetical protein
MSANFPPPPQPPAGQNPYAAPPQAPYGAPAQPGFNAAAYPPPVVAARRENVGLGVVAGVVAAVVAALAYGGLLRALAKDDGTTTEFHYAAVAVGALIGFAVGKAGGRNVALPFVAGLVALGSVIFGELFGGALVISHYADQHGVSLSVTDIFFHHFGDLWKAWKADFSAARFIFLALAAVVGFGLAKRVGES